MTYDLVVHRNWLQQIWQVKRFYSFWRSAIVLLLLAQIALPPLSLAPTVYAQDATADLYRTDPDNIPIGQIPASSPNVTPTPTDTPSAIDCSAVTEIPAVECEALVAFYRTTNGDHWQNRYGWLYGTTPCNWLGVTCMDGHVIKLELGGNQLSGSLPSELGNLAGLSALALWDNQLGGSLPPELGNLSKLHYLYISYNPLSGPLPSSLTKLSNMRYFFFTATALCVPNEQVMQEWIHSIVNLASSGIPCGDVANDDFDQSMLIPELPFHQTSNTFFATTAADDPVLCASSGGVYSDTVWFQLVAPATERLRVRTRGSDYNTLLAVFSGNRGDLTMLACNDDDNNSLQSQVTLTITAGITYYIEVAQHIEQGIVETPTPVVQRQRPQSIVNSPQAAVLSPSVASGNLVLAVEPLPPPVNCGTVSEIPVSECQALIAFYYSTDGDSWYKYDGWPITSMPCSWHGVSCTDGHVTALSFEDFYGSGLSGTIPPEIGNLTNLQYIALDNNQIGGSIPPELGNLSNLQTLGLSYNRLSGSIPPEFGKLTNLQYLGLNNNQLSGPLPSSLTALSSLSMFWFDATQLCVPDEMQSWLNSISRVVSTGLICDPVLPTLTATAVATPSPTATLTPLSTVTATATPTPTATMTPVPTATATPSPSATPPVAKTFFLYLPAVQR